MLLLVRGRRCLGNIGPAQREGELFRKKERLELRMADILDLEKQNGVSLL